MPELSDQQRENVQSALVRAMRARYPGRAVTVEWDQSHPIGDRPASRHDDDRAEHAA